jgi:hypothetical protein
MLPVSNVTVSRQVDATTRNALLGATADAVKGLEFCQFLPARPE